MRGVVGRRRVSLIGAAATHPIHACASTRVIANEWARFRPITPSDTMATVRLDRQFYAVDTWSDTALGRRFWPTRTSRDSAEHRGFAGGIAASRS